METNNITINCERYAELVLAEQELNILRRAYLAKETYSIDIVAKAVFGEKEVPQDA